jgi:hypothetical protein
MQKLLVLLVPGQTVTCLHTNRPGHIWTTLYLLLFHCSNGFLKASQCYVIRTLPVFGSLRFRKKKRLAGPRSVETIMTVVTVIERRFRNWSSSTSNSWGPRCKFEPRFHLRRLMFWRNFPTLGQFAVCPTLPLPIAYGRIHYSLIVILPPYAMQLETLIPSFGWPISE